MFLFKKIVSHFFFPLSVINILLVLGLLYLWSSRRKQLGKWLVTAGSVLLLILSYGIISNQVLGSLETAYPPLIVPSEESFPRTHRLDSVKWVIVLSGGGSINSALPLTSQLSHETIVRMVEGVCLVLAFPGRQLLVSGSEEEAKLMAELSQVLGVPKDRIAIESHSRDTKDQAKHIRPLIRDDPAILVTSASHMPRSMALFAKQGMFPIAAPVGHLVLPYEEMTLYDFFPDPRNLVRAERAVYEYLGIIWAWVRDQI